MKTEQFLQQDAFKDLHHKMKKIEDELKLNSFNLFTLSSSKAYLENFHSGVIALLLNPNERHKQGIDFLNLFLDYLNTLGCNINKQDYTQCSIHREQGFIDILIKDSKSKKAIIIENKINNAVDTYMQLSNYYHLAKNAHYDVDAIVYLSLNGYKNAPSFKDEEINQKVKNIAAFNNQELDLTLGWLQKCYDNSNSEDNRTFIFQYIKLLKHLSQTGMDNQIRADFYEAMALENNFEISVAISKLIEGLPDYRGKLFHSKIGQNISPFSNKGYYLQPNYLVFNDYIEDGVTYKLDLIFTKEGDVKFYFWCPNQEKSIQERAILAKLKSIGLLDQFTTFEGLGNGWSKTFTIEKYKTIQNVDAAILKYVVEFFEKLKNSPPNQYD